MGTREQDCSKFCQESRLLLWYLTLFTISQFPPEIYSFYCTVSRLSRETASFLELCLTATDSNVLHPHKGVQQRVTECLRSSSDERRRICRRHKVSGSQRHSVKADAWILKQPGFPSGQITGTPSKYWVWLQIIINKANIAIKRAT